MTWHDLLFAHWPVESAVLRSLIPSRLDVDTHDGQAWVGVVPFWMSRVRPRGCPGLTFDELNVRTYVTDGRRPGVWFFSLDAANRLAVTMARRFFHLPYFNADMSSSLANERVLYSSRRTHRGAKDAEFRAEYGPAGSVFASAPGSLEHFLTERYCLYAATAAGEVRCGEIHHAPWPLQPATVRIDANTVAAASGISLPSMPPICHFAKRIDVVAWSTKQLQG